MQRAVPSATDKVLVSLLAEEFNVSEEKARAILGTSDGMPEARYRLQAERKPRTERVTP